MVKLWDPTPVPSVTLLPVSMLSGTCSPSTGTVFQISFSFSFRVPLSAFTPYSCSSPNPGLLCHEFGRSRKVVSKGWSSLWPQSSLDRLPPCAHMPHPGEFQVVESQVGVRCLGGACLLWDWPECATPLPQEVTGPRAPDCQSNFCIKNNEFDTLKHLICSRWFLK